MSCSPQSFGQTTNEPYEEHVRSAFTFRSRINSRKYSDVCKDPTHNNVDTAIGKPEGLLIDLTDSGVSLTQDFEASMDPTNNATSTTAGTATGSSPPKPQGKWQQQQRGRRRPSANRRKHITFQSPAANSDLESGGCPPTAPEPAAIVEVEPALPPNMDYKSSNSKVPVNNKFEPLSKYEFAPPAADPAQEILASMDGPEVETAPPGLPEEPNGRPSVLPEVPAKKRSRGKIARTVFILKDGVQAISDGLGVSGTRKEPTVGEEWIVVPLDDERDGNGASGHTSEFLNEDWLDAMEEIDQGDSD